MMRIEGLTVWIPEEKTWIRNRTVREKRVLIDNVSGCIKENEFVAVIGPSGAGKTTLLVSLAGKSCLPTAGAVAVSGANVKDGSQLIEIVPQYDVFFDTLTVQEHLVFMIEMKLGSSKTEFNKHVLKTLLNDLRLNNLRDSVISSLSGGERRLLSLASSLISNPYILIADEPTTGLDSYNALLVVSTLKTLSSGKIVICSIHQPSSEVLELFSSVILMAEGKMLFNGSLDECSGVFESINLRCPTNYNPAEFYMRALSNQKCVEKVVEIYKNRSLAVQETSLNATEHITLWPFTEGIKDKKSDEKLRLQRNWFIQVYLLIWRLTLTIRRSIRDHIIQLFISIMISTLIISTCYVGIKGTTQQGVQDIRGLLWLIVSELCFSVSYSALYVFQYEIPLFKREAGMYRCSAYYVARFLSCIPRSIIWTVIQITIVSLAVELPNHFITSLEFIGILIVASMACVAYGLGMSAIFSTSGVISDVMPCADLPLLLMSGAFLRIASLPAWLYPVKYVSHFYYTMDAVSSVYWTKIDKIDCPWNSTTICLKDGASVLYENGYSSDYLMQDGLGLLSVTILWSLLGYLGLRREVKKGYAY